MSKITMLVAVLGFVAAAGAAQAMTAAPIGPNPSIASDVRMGCGPGMQPNAFNRCVPNRRAPVMRRLVCPRGTHLAPSGRRCLPNRF
ncbi:hypothetical protein [Labrys monachus]|uniref:Uncharacterized protein n=1 Tax=Labrys monachus TaxID=217067 RepID=A0ABU0FDJ1_9HYPH|nr:hypothetical protein [Labrys monachus]MDQ0392675.1 hypothetical protein [Labrys monachus]